MRGSCSPSRQPRLPEPGGRRPDPQRPADRVHLRPEPAAALRPGRRYPPARTVVHLPGEDPRAPARGGSNRLPRRPDRVRHDSRHVRGNHPFRRALPNERGRRAASCLARGAGACLPERVALPHVRPDGMHPRLLPGARADRRQADLRRQGHPRDGGLRARRRRTSGRARGDRRFARARPAHHDGLLALPRADRGEGTRSLRASCANDVDLRPFHHRRGRRSLLRRPQRRHHQDARRESGSVEVENASTMSRVCGRRPWSGSRTSS